MDHVHAALANFNANFERKVRALLVLNTLDAQNEIASLYMQKNNLEKDVQYAEAFLRKYGTGEAFAKLFTVGSDGTLRLPMPTKAPIVTQPRIPQPIPYANRPQPIPYANRPQPIPYAHRPQPIPYAHRPQPTQPYVYYGYPQVPVFWTYW